MVQCAALKPDATKCKSHAAGRSKYCNSHQGWRPKGLAKKKLDALDKARKMKTVRKRAKSTSGGKGAIRNRPAAIRVLGSRAQCAATTASGSRCKRLPRDGSKYCLSHKGYRQRSRQTKS